MNDAKESDLEFTAGKEIFKYIKYIKEIRVIQSFVTPHILSKKKKITFGKRWDLNYTSYLKLLYLIQSIHLQMGWRL